MPPTHLLPVPNHAPALKEVLLVIFYDVVFASLPDSGLQP